MRQSEIYENLSDILNAGLTLVNRWKNSDLEFVTPNKTAPVTV
jgi:hypothetical protein